MDIRRAMTLVESNGREDDRDEYFRVQDELQSRYDRDDENDFEVISHRDQRHSKERPLVIIIHPGDAIESPEGWDSDDFKKVRRFSRNNQLGMAMELSDWRRQNDADVAILHRSSSCLIDAGDDCHDEYDFEIRNGMQRGSVAFGDDLQKAADWMISALHIADRPHIFLTGAYSEPDAGCLTFIGRKLEAVVGPERISVSKYSPPGNGPGKVWRPGNQNIRFGKDR